MSAEKRELRAGLSGPRATGRPRWEEADPAMARKIREALGRGEAPYGIAKRLGISADGPARIQREMRVEQRARALLTLVPLIDAAIRGGLTRRQVSNILFQATGLEIAMGKERDG